MSSLTGILGNLDKHLIKRKFTTNSKWLEGLKDEFRETLKNRWYIIGVSSEDSISKGPMHVLAKCTKDRTGKG